jgi:hypothetical protein
MDRRVSEGSDLKTIRHELASAYRMKSMGYQKPPTLRMLQTHQEKHRGMAMPSAHLPTFSGEESTSLQTSDGGGVPHSSGDIATAIQQEALQKLADGEIRITAQHALKAQEMLDRRAEKAQDRQLTVLLARLQTTEAPPPALIVGDDAIEGEYEEVDSGTAD